MQVVQNPYPLLNDTAARLIDAGRVFIGVPYGDPELEPTGTFWDKALTIPAAQPLETVAGYIVRNGAPARVYTAGPYSMRVRQRNGAEVFYDPNSADGAGDDGGGGGELPTDEGVWSASDEVSNDEGIWS